MPLPATCGVATKVKKKSACLFGKALSFFYGIPAASSADTLSGRQSVGRFGSVGRIIKSYTIAEMRAIMEAFVGSSSCESLTNTAM